METEQKGNSALVVCGERRPW